MSPIPQVDTVFGDDEQAVLRSDHLADSGAWDIGASASSASPAAFSAGCAATCRLLCRDAPQRSLPIMPELFAVGDWSSESGEHAMHDLSGAAAAADSGLCRQRPDGDWRDGGGTESGAAMCQADIAIMGFDDIPPADLGAAPLDHVAQHPAEMGRVMAGRCSSASKAATAGRGAALDSVPVGSA
jgi:DNA-binding LacI/PurR family transcriptional regulator